MTFIVIWLVIGTLAGLATIMIQFIWYDSLIFKDQETAREFLKYVGLAFCWPIAIAWYTYRIINKAVKG